MAEGDGLIFTNFKEELMEGVFDLLNDTIKVALIHGAAPNRDTDIDWEDDLDDQEVSDGGVNYTTGGEALTTPTCVQDDVNHLGKFSGDDVEWTSLLLTTPADATPDYAVMYDVTTLGTLIAYWELATVTNGGNFKLAWSVDGIITLT